VSALEDADEDIADEDIRVRGGWMCLRQCRLPMGAPISRSAFGQRRLDVFEAV